MFADHEEKINVFYSCMLIGITHIAFFCRVQVLLWAECVAFMSGFKYDRYTR